MERRIDVSRDGTKIDHLIFDNGIPEVIKYLKNSKYSTSKSKSHSNSYEFTGTNTFKEAFEYLYTGLHDNIIDINKIKNTIQDTITTLTSQNKTRILYDVTGDYLDIGRFVCCDPECFGSIIDSIEPTETVIVRFNIAVSSGIDKTLIRNRGAMALAIIELLQNMGKYVELDIFDQTHIGQNPFEETINRNCFHFQISIKINVTNYYSYGLLTFILTHPSMLRRIIFAISEEAQKKSDLVNYGRPSKIGRAHV